MRVPVELIGVPRRTSSAVGATPSHCTKLSRARGRSGVYSTISRSGASPPDARSAMSSPPQCAPSTNTLRSAGAVTHAGRRRKSKRSGTGELRNTAAGADSAEDATVKSDDASAPPSVHAGVTHRSSAGLSTVAAAVKRVLDVVRGAASAHPPTPDVISVKVQV